MEADERVSAYLDALPTEVRSGRPGEWSLTLQAAGHPLEISLARRSLLLRAEAAVLPPGLIEPRQLLFWNRQAPLVCFAENEAGEVLVCGEVPLRALDAEVVDQFLGLLLASATRAREFVLPGA